ncbi:MAG: dipeptidase, partial [Acidobacteriota bacterium]
IEDDLGLLRCYHRLGVSSMTITHNKTHNWADSHADEHRWDGLNEFGESVVREMNRIGMVIDCSHVSDETFYDVIMISQDPIILSHSGCRALCDHPRNVTDDMLRALAKNGGVIGIVTVLQYVTQEYRDARRELSKISRPYLMRAPVAKDLDLQIALSHLRAGQDWPDENLPTVEDVLDHIDHAVKVAGVDCVGLGADMYPRTPAPIGLKDVTEYINITRGLKKRGYSDQDVRKILGGNFLRVWREVTEKRR